SAGTWSASCDQDGWRGGPTDCESFWRTSRPVARSASRTSSLCRDPLKRSVRRERGRPPLGLRRELEQDPNRLTPAAASISLLRPAAVRGIESAGSHPARTSRIARAVAVAAASSRLVGSLRRAPEVRGAPLVLSASIAGCGSSSSTFRTTNSATPATPATTRAAASPQVPSKPGGVTGFGATGASWNSAYTPDRQFAPGAVYDADPSLPSINGGSGAAYTQVLHQDGHAIGYYYAFQPVPVNQAKTLVLSSQFPPDALELWFVTKGTCAQMMVPQLARRRT